MRTEQQIKRKLNELISQRKVLESHLGDGSSPEAIRPQLDQLNQMIIMLEWVLNEPTGSYHV
jgi:hypothetical protein